jgi:hypothetical protein
MRAINPSARARPPLLHAQATKRTGTLETYSIVAQVGGHPSHTRPPPLLRIWLVEKGKLWGVGFRVSRHDVRSKTHKGEPPARIFEESTLKLRVQACFWLSDQIRRWRCQHENKENGYEPLRSPKLEAEEPAVAFIVGPYRNSGCAFAWL